MTFVIYNKETTKLAYRANRGISKQTWNTESSAKSFLTRCEKGLSKIPYVNNFHKDDYAIAEKDFFHKNIEKMQEGICARTGNKIVQPVNIPYHLDKTFSNYWQS